MGWLESELVSTKFNIHFPAVNYCQSQILTSLVRPQLETQTSLNTWVIVFAALAAGAGEKARRGAATETTVQEFRQNFEKSHGFNIKSV